MTKIETVVGNFDDLKDGQMKEVVVGETGKKILLSRVNGQYYATSHLCTHYKAPLMKGSLNANGTVICPWHGACFSVKSGDIEEAPALDPLVKHEVKIVGKEVILVTTEELLQKTSVNPLGSGACKMMNDKETTVIVGGGAAGLVAAETLRKEGYGGNVIIVSAESHLPVDRIKLSKGYGGDVSKILLRNEDFFKKANIEFRGGLPVKSIDTDAKKVCLSDGATISYSSLILASGGEARTLPVKGSELGNIHVLRSVSDANSILALVDSFGERKPKIVVVGTSFIGMEAAAFLVGRATSLTVVGIEKTPFERVLGEKIGSALQRLHEANGVIVKTGSGISHFEGDNKKVGSVVLTSGEKLPADLVVLGVGVRPQTDYLKGGKIPLEKDGSVLVNERMQVKGFPGVYAVGDIARFPLKMLDGHVTRIEHWNVAQQQGRIAALNITGVEGSSYDYIPFFWTMMFGKGLRYCGHAIDYDDIIIEGDLANPDSMSFVAYYVKGEKVLAVASVAKDPVVAHASLLLQRKLMPKSSELRKGKDILTISA